MFNGSLSIMDGKKRELKDKEDRKMETAEGRAPRTGGDSYPD